jgi:hypothetical protein
MKVAIYIEEGLDVILLACVLYVLFDSHQLSVSSFFFFSLTSFFLIYNPSHHGIAHHLLNSNGSTTVALLCEAHVRAGCGVMIFLYLVHRLDREIITPRARLRRVSVSITVQMGCFLRPKPI